MGKIHRKTKALQKQDESTRVELEQRRVAKLPLVNRLTWLLGGLTLLIYTLTLYPNVPGGDSGELIAVAHTLGIAHPPGYPLFTLLGKLFTWIPYGSPAWRVNFFSAVCDSGAAIFLFLTVVRLTGNVWAGFFSGGLFAFSPLIWTYAVQAEVFPLNNLLTAILMFLTLCFFQTKNAKYAYLAALCFGLGLSNHHTILFIGGPAALWILWIGSPELTQRKNFLKLSLCFLAGLALYFYLPLAALRNPKIMWGDLLSWDGFITHITRKEYGSLRLAASDAGADLFKGLFYYLWQLPKETFFVGFFLAVFGLVQTLRSEKRLGYVALSLICFSAYILVFHALANLSLDDPLFYGIYQRFWQLGNLFIFLWAGLGFELFFLRVKLPQKIQMGLSIGVVLLSIALLYPAQDQHRNYLFHDFGKFILKSLPPDALLLSRGDIYTNTTRYLQESENYRPDVKVIDRVLISYPWMKQQINHHFPEVSFPGFHYRYSDPNHVDPEAFLLRDILNANKKKFPLFVCNLDVGEDPHWHEAYDSWPYGLVNWFFPKDIPFDLDRYLRETDQVNASIDFDSLPKGTLISWEHYMRNEYWEAEHRRGRRLMTHGIQMRNPVVLNHSIEIMQKLAGKHPLPPAQLFKNLGYAYSQLSAFQPQASQGMVKAWKRYLEFNDPDPDTEVIRKAVKEHSS